MRQLFDDWSDAPCMRAYAYGCRHSGCRALPLLGCRQGRLDEATEFCGVVLAGTHPGDKALDFAPTDVDHCIRTRLQVLSQQLDRGIIASHPGGRSLNESLKAATLSIFHELP